MRLDFGHAESGPEDSAILQIRFHHRGYGNGVRGARCSSRLRTAPVVSTDAIFGITVKQLPEVLKARWPEMKRQLLQGRYQPQPVRRVTIPLVEACGSSSDA